MNHIVNKNNIVFNLLLDQMVNLTLARLLRGRYDWPPKSNQIRKTKMFTTNLECFKIFTKTKLSVCPSLFQANNLLPCVAPKRTKQFFATNSQNSLKTNFDHNNNAALPCKTKVEHKSNAHLFLLPYRHFMMASAWACFEFLLRTKIYTNMMCTNW